MTNYTSEAALFGARLVHPDKECFIQNGRVLIKFEFEQTELHPSGYIYGDFDIRNDSDWVALFLALRNVYNIGVMPRPGGGYEVAYKCTPLREEVRKKLFWLKHDDPGVLMLMVCEVLKDELLQVV